MSVDNKESFFTDNKYSIIFVTGIVLIASLWYVFLGHDALASMAGIDKEQINWINSQTACNWLNQYEQDLNVHEKWFKDSVDNILLNKMHSLNCTIGSLP